MKIFGFSLVLVGVLLLLVTCLGHWTSVGEYDCAMPREGERFDPNLVKELNTFPRLLQATRNQLSENPDQREIMDVLYNIVTERFTHKAATHTFFSNWILYCLGKIHAAFSHIYDPNLLVSKGHSLLCDQSSYILLRLALAHGVKARHVGLYGHVVMEAWYDWDWHLYDPDLEVVPFDSGGQVLSVEKLALNHELLEKYYGPKGASHILGSRENNTFMTYPEGAWFEWKTNVLVYIEKLMQVLKFVLPLVFIVIGLWVIKRLKKIQNDNFTAGLRSCT